MDLPDEIFVLVLESDIPRHMENELSEHIAEPIVIETTMTMATRASAAGLYHRWKQQDHGAVKIGRLIFSDVDQIRPVDTVEALRQYDDKRIEALLISIGVEPTPCMRSKVLGWISRL